MAFSIVLLLVFGLGLVWLNIERVDMAYELNKMQRSIDEVDALVAKLEVERNMLVAPARLRELANQYALGPARPGQIRQVGPTGEVQSAPMVSVNDAAKPKTAVKSATAAAGTGRTARAKRKP
jgi:cell division protein FtsL